MARVVILVVLAVVLFYPVYYIFLRSPPPIPDLDLNEWWGPADLKTKQDTSVRPFKVKFDEGVIKDLKDRLKRHRTLTPPLEGTGFEYGFNSGQINSWVKYWIEEYKFGEREAFFNQYPHYKTNIQGLDIHFIRVTPKVPAGVEVVPLILLHGWPGSVREFYESIPLLTAVNKDRNFALELIIPSLPGYGFSDATVRPGLSAPHVAVIMRNLMNRLGFKQYYVQGGDWGAIIGTAFATMFPKEVLGYHTNMAMILTSAGTFLDLIGSLYPPLIVDPKYADRMYPLTNRYKVLLQESGYMHMQSTKPDTVGVALSDSPTGLLAYILEKFAVWTRPDLVNQPDGGLSYRFSKDQLLDNLMVYWSTKSITTSMRFYAENFNSKATAFSCDEIPTPVPTWVMQAKYELSYQPPAILKLKYPNLVNTTVLDEGGHFLAFEMPEVFAQDVLKAIGEIRKIGGKKGKTEL